MSKYWEIALTYVYRPRFWVFAAIYVATAWGWARLSDSYMLIVTSANFACVLGCFLALHVRRQFGGSSAKMLPGFVVPHLTVAAAASLLVWVVIPAVQAWRGETNPWASIAVHSLAGTFLALVVCWPKAISLLAVLPVVVIGALTYRVPQGGFVRHFLDGREPATYGALIGLAVLAHPIAALFLLRLSDQNAAVSDDFVSDVQRSPRAPGALSNWLLGHRDAVVDWRLAGVGRGWWTVQRWRIPVAVSNMQLVMAAVVVALLMAVVYWTSKRTPEAAWLAMVMATGIMLVAPYGPWHWRRNWMGTELMRPVSRPRYFRELAAAMALDVCMWTGLASAITIAVALQRFQLGTASFFGPAFRSWSFLSAQLITLWGASIFLYGLGLATLRLRYWMPLMTLLGIVWMVVIVLVAGTAEQDMRQPNVAVTGAIFVSFWAASAGLVLATITYFRSLFADVE